MEKAMDDFPEIPGCKILRELGQGGVAKVYLGIQENLNREVAIKVLEPLLLKDKGTTVRFKKEAKIAASLSHSSIIHIYNIGKFGDYHYILMEYLEESLKDRLESSQQGKMPLKSALDIIKEMLKALDYAHLKGVYHRDLKPENIMFKQDNTPVLLDFGIARVFDATETLTVSGSLMGTVYYMSPEQCRSQQVDGRSDIYSLGVILYEMLTGEKPYNKESMISLALQHIEEPVPKLPEALNLYQPLIDKMMAKDKNERLSGYPDFEQLFNSIPGESASSTSPPVKSPPAIPKTKSAYSLFIKLGKVTKQSFGKFLDFIKQKPGPVIRRMKEKLDSLIKHMKGTLKPIMKSINERLSASIIRMRKKLNSFMDYFSQRQFLAGALSVILLMSISVILFLLGSQASNILRNPNPIYNSPPINLPISNSYSTIYKFFIRTLPYHICLSIARELNGRGDLVSLNEALVTINLLKKIKITKEVKELSKEITNRIESEEKFDSYFDAAKSYLNQGKLLKAKENVTWAKQVKTTPGLVILDNRIEREYAKVQKYYKQLRRGKKQEEEREKKDHQSYKLAKSTNTIPAYQKYLDEFPGGLHVKEATLKINNLGIKPPQDKTKIKLRNQERPLDYYHVELTIKGYDFFAQNFNKNGFFKSDYQKTKDGSPVVIDYTTYLMWYDGKKFKRMTFKKAKKWINNLNHQDYAGYNDWRFPTLEEAASLLRKKKNSKNGMYIDPIFTGDQRIIWTKDRFIGDKERCWVILFHLGIITTYPDNIKHQVRPVRSSE